MSLSYQLSILILSLCVDFRELAGGKEKFAYRILKDKNIEKKGWI